MLNQKMINLVEDEWNTLVADLQELKCPLPNGQMYVFALALETLLNQVQSEVEGT